MARDLDAQLLESVTVRRTRLRDALLRGRLRGRRTASENVTRVLVGAVLASLLSAGCVGWSYLQDALAKSAAQQSRTAVPAATASLRSPQSGQPRQQQRGSPPASRSAPPPPVASPEPARS